MDLYDQPHYRTTKNFAILIGRWPYQSPFQSVVILVVIWTAFILQAIPQTIAIIKHYDNRAILLECLPAYAMDIVMAIKYINLIYNAETIKHLFELMREDWKLLKNEEEKRILQYHTDIGRLLASVYAGFAFTTTGMFVMEPVLPRIVNKIIKSNETVPLKFALPLEYIFFKKEDHYWPMLTITNIFAINIIVVIISCDVIFITCIQHVCGIFAVIGFRIENASTGGARLKDKYGISVKSNLQDPTYKHLVSCIRIHRRAFYLADILEETFTQSFGVVVALNLPLMSITGLQLITQSNTVEQTIKFALFAAAQMMHLFFDCFLSQNLTDMSIEIQQCISNVKWYKSSKESQKILLLMLMRSQVPCKVTAAKIMELSIENFGNMVKTSGSYFTMLLSMQ
ncbi:odorant receptor 22c-like [Cotesia glomerata]|uniref:odorant receptor 22c-like n=1 Tax=Cotesia glomerata TaxID=32391 RepID=UPI001D021A13|nr:odorant receptor 22c-like [Cotesia glomerata]